MTKPFVLPAGRLYVNVAATKGWLRVGVSGEKGQPIKGFEESQEIRVDRTSAEVSWPGAKLDDLRGQTVRLRFTLQDGKLFSYRIGSVADRQGPASEQPSCLRLENMLRCTAHDSREVTLFDEPEVDGERTSPEHSDFGLQVAGGTTCRSHWKLYLVSLSLLSSTS